MRQKGEMHVRGPGSATEFENLHHDKQKHYSGTYWSSTLSGHVIYESRLKLANLMIADFDIRVKRA